MVFTRWCRCIGLGAVLALAGAAAAQSTDTNLWESVTEIPTGKTVWVQPETYRQFSLNHTTLNGLLQHAPGAKFRATASKTEISLPMPDGTQTRFQLVESDVMAPELAAKFPEIKTYLGQGIDDPDATVRLDISPAGFHAQILSPNGAVYVDPHYRGDTNLYVSYYKRDYRRQAADFECFTATGDVTTLEKALVTPKLLAAGNLRTYRLAVAATGEYTAYQGGTLSAGMAAIVTAVNRVTGVYQSEVGVQLQLVANNNLIVYTNSATDPYNNTNSSLLLSQNQSNIDFMIGSANYDIGHVFSTAGGGLATVGCVCVNGSKARGETGTSTPTGDGYYIDYVAHEMGHQFGAYHTFNSTTSSCGGNRTAGDAYEPGSGTTIMAYAGICGADNLQVHSDPYFHSASLDEIVTFITSGSGSGCPVTTATGNNAPSVSAGLNYTIPRSTPFMLTATGSDPDGDSLTYCWEERDLGPAATVASGDNGSSPIFRTFNPTSSPSRIFPRLSDILNNVNTAGETLPTKSRTLNFRVIARDNRANGGGLNTADMQVTVNSNAGPFSITIPNTAVTWSNLQTVTWNVASTTASPINTTNVNILLSTNGGTTFPIILASNVPNSGSRIVQLPSISVANARIEVQAAGNIYFAITRSNFNIIPSSADLVVAQVASTNAINLGSNVTYTINVTNLGPLTASGVVVTSTFPAALTCLSANCAQGTCTTNATGFSCALGTMTNGAKASITMIMRGSLPGVVTNIFLISSAANDPVSTNNAASVAIVVNSSPIISAISNQVTLEDVPTSAIGFVVGDAELAAGSLIVSGISSNTNLVPNANIVFGGSGSNRTVTITPAAHYYGSATITVSVSDGAATTNTSFLLTVNQVNHAPVLAALTNYTILETVPFVFTNGATDIELPPQALTFSLSNAPAGAVINPTNGIFTWTPTEAQGPATNQITVFVTDNGSPPLADAKSFTVWVTESNLPPVLLAQSNRTVVVLATLTVTNTASDLDIPTNALTYLLVGAPTNAAIDSKGVISWTPVASQVLTTNLITTVVTDTNPAAVNAQSLSATNSFSVVVAAIHNGPALSTQATRTVDELTMLVVTNAATDGDIPALALSYHLENSPTNATIDTNGVIRWTPDEACGPATNIIQAVVSDDGSPSLSATNTITVVIREVNTAPLLPVQTNLTIVGLTALTVTNTATDTDLPANPLGYVLAGAPTNAMIDTNGIITWMPVPAQVPSTNLFTTIVTDSSPQAVNAQNLSATNSFTVVVTAIHNGPQLVAQEDRTIDELTMLAVTNTATYGDIPALVLSYHLENSPANATIDANGVIHWTPGEDQGPTTNVITTVISDGGAPALTSTNSFLVVVQEINLAPVLPWQTNRTIAGSATLTVTNTATDTDLPANALTYVLVGGPTNAVIDANGVISWTPGPGQVPGTNVFTCEVTDFNPSAVNVQNLKATNTFAVVVSAIHNGPQLTSQPDRTINELTMLVVTNSASDADIPALGLAYHLENSPTNAVIDTNGVIYWTPNEGQGPSTSVITTIVTDGGAPALSATNSFTVTVREINSPPVLPSPTNYTIAGLATLIVTNTASDADLPANEMSYVLTGGPTNAVIDTNGVIAWTPDASQVPGTNIFETVVTDYNPLAVNEEYLSATNTFTVVVTAIHNGPTLPAQPDRTINALSTLIVTNTAIDSDVPSLALNYQLVNPPAGAVIDTNGWITWTPGEAQSPGTNLITTVVTDAGDPPLSATNSFAIFVNDLATVAPTLAAIADRTVVEGELLVVTNTATGPGSETNHLTFGLETNAPAGSSIDITNGVFTWTPTELQGPGSNFITVVLTNADYPGYLVRRSFTVTVLESNSAPVLAGIADRVIHAGTSLTISNSAGDSDIPANTLTYTLGSGAPPAASIDAANGVFNWTTTEADINTTNLVSVIVTDNGTPNLNDAKSFTVTVVPPPSFTLVTQTNAVVTLTWSAIPGQGYEIQYLDLVTGTNWTVLPLDVTASGATASANDIPGLAAERYYRIRVKP